MKKYLNYPFHDMISENEINILQQKQERNELNMKCFKFIERIGKRMNPIGDNLYHGTESTVYLCKISIPEITSSDVMLYSGPVCMTLFYEGKFYAGNTLSDIAKYQVTWQNFLICTIIGFVIGALLGFQNVYYNLILKWNV